MQPFHCHLWEQGQSSQAQDQVFSLSKFLGRVQNLAVGVGAELFLRQSLRNIGVRLLVNDTIFLGELNQHFAERVSVPTAFNCKERVLCEE